MVEVGQIKEINIIDINHMGKGVGKIDDFVIFVDGAITKDKVKIKITEKKKSYAIGKLLEILNSSDLRINPPCNHFENCGGCHLMHVNYQQQLVYKKNRVINELKRANINLENVIVSDTIGMENPFRYRNKTAFSVTKKNNEVSIGPYEQGTYNTVDIGGCLIQSKESDEIINLFKSLMLKYKISAYDRKSGKGTVRNIVIRNSRKNDIMLIIVTATENFPEKQSVIDELTAKIKNIKTVIQNINKKKTNLILGDKSKVLFGDGTIQDYIGNLTFTISPETFFQINPVQTEKLYQTAIAYADLSKEDICFDIYCGIGTISLMSAKYAKKVIGVEIVEQSIINARENAKKNNINNAQFHSGKAEEIVPKLYKNNIIADVIIIDPPRKGCEKEVLETIVNMSPKKVVYVSCNPSTLARDISYLENGGYKLQKVQPVDQFPWTVHVETVLLITQKIKEVD